MVFLSDEYLKATKREGSYSIRKACKCLVRIWGHLFVVDHPVICLHPLFNFYGPLLKKMETMNNFIGFQVQELEYYKAQYPVLKQQYDAHVKEDHDYTQEISDEMERLKEQRLKS